MTFAEKQWFGKIRKFLSSTRGKDVLLYLLFVAISAIFWCVLTLGNLIQTHYKVKLKIEGVPPGTTLITDCPEHIDVSVKNNGYAFVRYMVGAVPEIAINFGNFADGKGGLIVKKQSLEELLRSAFGQDASIDAFSPEQLALKYTTNPGRKIPVVVNGDFTADMQYVVSGKAVAYPQYVTVYSDAENMSMIKSISTTRIVRHNLREQIEVKVALVKSDNVKLDPDSVVVRIPVEPLVSKEQEVAIEVVNCPQNEHLVAFPATMKITYLLPLSVYNGNSVQVPTVYVDYKDIKAGMKKIPLHVMESKIFHGVSLPTDSVEYIIE